MTPHRSIVIATGNTDKLREIQAIMRDLPIEWKALGDFPGLPEAIEDGRTFAENAAFKAIQYGRLAGIWALADDSGLEVDALDGAPGVYSARFAGTPSNAAANNAKLLQALRGVPPERRTARFRCAVAVADGQDVVVTAEGAIEGLIVDEPRGTNGFGYDPLFWVPDHRMTTAQMPSELKNSISHRGRALAALKPALARVVEARKGM